MYSKSIKFHKTYTLFVLFVSCDDAFQEIGENTDLDSARLNKRSGVGRVLLNGMNPEKTV